MPRLPVQKLCCRMNTGRRVCADTAIGRRCDVTSASDRMVVMPMRMEDGVARCTPPLTRPVQPVETGWFVPPDPEKNAGPLPKDLVTQTEDVLVDTRGYVYVTAKNWGVWVLRYGGPDQPAPTDR